MVVTEAFILMMKAEAITDLLPSFIFDVFKQ